MLKRIIALALTAALTLSMVACGTPAAAPEGGEAEGPKTTFRYSELSEIPTLDPQLANSVPSNTTAFSNQAQQNPGKSLKMVSHTHSTFVI